jgi:hypothetical protein
MHTFCGLCCSSRGLCVSKNTQDPPVIMASFKKKFYVSFASSVRYTSRARRVEIYGSKVRPILQRRRAHNKRKLYRTENFRGEERFIWQRVYCIENRGQASPRHDWEACWVHTRLHGWSSFVFQFRFPYPRVLLFLSRIEFVLLIQLHMCNYVFKTFAHCPL